jgi:hypothetical protein
MTQELKYTATNDSVTVIWGGKPVTVKRGAANFEGLRRAVLDHDWNEVPYHLSSGASLERWAKGKFKVADGRVLFNGAELPADINNRITEMAIKGEDPGAIMKFWERLQKNPSMRSVQQLWNFLNNIGIPITEDGCFLAYKAVRSDLMDVHSGTIKNDIGSVIEMPRNQISDDPDHACHAGLHVGALEYTGNFHSGGVMLICKVDPADVVCVPNDHSYQKMRVCRYEVLGIHGGESHLPSTTIKEEELPQRPVKGKRSKEFQRLDGLDATLLMKESYDDLRRYAASGLGIIGASRITGGKWALVLAISKARSQVGG